MTSFLLTVRDGPETLSCWGLAPGVRQGHGSPIRSTTRRLPVERESAPGAARPGPTPATAAEHRALAARSAQPVRRRRRDDPAAADALERGLAAALRGRRGGRRRSELPGRDA